MTAFARDPFADRIPDKLEIENAELARQTLASFVKPNEVTHFSLCTDDGAMHDITLHPSIAMTVMQVLRLVSSGQGFQLMPVDAMLTTQQAADQLNVSRPHLIKLLGEGKIFYETVGRHRRIKAKDVFEYKAKRSEERHKIMADMLNEEFAED